jgi:hypothetical protein
MAHFCTNPCTIPRTVKREIARPRSLPGVPVAAIFSQFNIAKCFMIDFWLLYSIHFIDQGYCQLNQKNEEYC